MEQRVVFGGTRFEGEVSQFILSAAVNAITHHLNRPHNCLIRLAKALPRSTVEDEQTVVVCCADVAIAQLLNLHGLGATLEVRLRKVDDIRATSLLRPHRLIHQNA